MLYSLLSYNSNIGLDRHALFARPAGDRRGHALDAAVRELGEPGGDDAERRCGVPRQAHHDASLALPASTPGKLERQADSYSAHIHLLGSHCGPESRYEGYRAVGDPVYVRGEPEFVRRAARHCYHGLPVAAL